MSRDRHSSQDSDTPERLISEAAQRLAAAGLSFGHGTDNPLDEAAWLVLDALDLPLDCCDERLQVPLAAEVVAGVNARISARIDTRLPAAYLTGSAWFAGLEFAISNATLVPRSPLAELILERFQPWVDADVVARIADIGTGSGCIAIACARAFPSARVDAVDVSPQALAVAGRNVARHDLSQRVRLLEGDGLEPLGGNHYDVIVSNPPYVPNADVDELPAEYRSEPRVGLAGGEDGMDIVAALVNAAAAHLAADGILVVEVGAYQDAFWRRFPGLQAIEVELAHGGEGVMVMDRSALDAFSSKQQ